VRGRWRAWGSVEDKIPRRAPSERWISAEFSLIPPTFTVMAEANECWAASQGAQGKFYIATKADVGSQAEGAAVRAAKISRRSSTAA